MAIKRIRKYKGKSFAIAKETPYVRHHKAPKSDYQRKLRNIKMSVYSRRPVDQTSPKTYNGLRFLGVVLHYFSIKYNFKKNDILLCLNLYNSSHFTVEEFNKASILNTGGYVSVFRRFCDLGYIIKVTHTIINPRKNAKNKVIDTDRYRLSNQVFERIRFIYKTVEEIDVLNEEDFDPYLASPKILNLVNKMNREVKDILSGKKKADVIIVTKEEEDNN